MSPWIEIFSTVATAVLGVLLGWIFSKLRKPWWTIGYFIPLTLVILVAVTRWVPELATVPMVSWFMIGRSKFAVFGFITTMLLTTPLSRLSQKRVRALVCVLMVIVVWGSAIWPVLSPMFNRAELLRLQTKMDPDGICIQSNDYTCGAAAAVTGLRKLGFPAEEGEVAVLARTSSASGTHADILATELQKHYGPDGLTTEFRYFKGLDDLKTDGITLAVVKYNLLLDHFVTVLEVTNDRVVIGDPLIGRVTLSSDEFMKKWRRVGVVLRRRD